MIDLYAWGSPNGRKISIALEEMGLDYKIHLIDITKEEQFAPSFLKHCPNNKTPAIYDPDHDVSVFESSAILTYLAEKSGKFLPTDLTARTNVLQWVAWQVAGFGPMLGQLDHFANVADQQEQHAIDRFLKEVIRLHQVLDKQLGENDFVAGEFSIADMATYTWSSEALEPIQNASGLSLANVAAWHARMEARPGVIAGLKAL